LRGIHDLGVTDADFAFCVCITYKSDGTLYFHMLYLTLAFCICDFITNWSIASSQEIL